MFTSLLQRRFIFPIIKETPLQVFIAFFFFLYLFLPYNRCKFCWVHSRKWMSEVYKVGDTLLISFLLSTPFLRSISFRNRVRYYFANNSSLRFCRDGRGTSIWLYRFPLPMQKLHKENWGFFFHIYLSHEHIYRSINRKLHAHPSMRRSAFITGILFRVSSMYKFANNTNLRFLCKIEERYRCERTLSLVRGGKKWKQDFFRILPPGKRAMDRS